MFGPLKGKTAADPHMGVMVRCPLTFGPIVNISNRYSIVNMSNDFLLLLSDQNIQFSKTCCGYIKLSVVLELILLLTQANIVQEN